VGHTADDFDVRAPGEQQLYQHASMAENLLRVREHFDTFFRGVIA
jgi:hypothetical protein